MALLNFLVIILNLLIEPRLYLLAPDPWHRSRPPQPLSASGSGISESTSMNARPRLVGDQMNGCHGRGYSMLVRKSLPREDSANKVEQKN